MQAHAGMQMIMPAPTLALASPNLITPSLITNTADGTPLPSPPASPTQHFTALLPAHDVCTSAPPLAPLIPAHRLQLSGAASSPVNHTSLPSPLHQLPPPSPAPPASAPSNLHPPSGLSSSQHISCVDSDRTHQYIRSHASFYALREGAGSSVDMKASVDVDDDDQQYECAEKNLHKQCRMIDEVETSNGNCNFAIDDHHEVGAEEDPELMYGLRQNPKRSRRFADQDSSSEEVEANIAIKASNAADDNDANLSAAEQMIRPASVSYKKSMFTKLQQKTPAACTECGKEFSSWKALFGHMRCHPEREWRGIQPPAEYSMRAPSKVSTGKPSTNGESKRYILVKPLQAAIKHCSQRRTELIKHFKPPPNDADRAIKHHANDGDDSLLGCFKDNHELQWSACRTQVMLEEEEESETESIEAAYMSNKEDRDGKSLHLLASLPRGKRSKRSHFTIKSLRSVQDQLAAEASHDQESQSPAKKEDLEMATCLVMLALAGSDIEVDKQEVKGTAFSKDEGIFVDDNDDDDDDDDDDDESEQLRLSWSRNNMCGTTEPRGLDGGNIDSTNIGSRDGTLNVGEGGKYECTACKRIFKTHQALGGHRASHKKVKGCFAKTAGDADASPPYSKDGLQGMSNFLGTSMLTLAGTCKNQSATASYIPLEPSVPEFGPGDCKDMPGTGSAFTGHDTRSAVVEGPGIFASASNAAESGHLHLLLNGMDVAATSMRSSKLALHNSSSKYHQCSICHRVFSSGQALGGHKRCHWAADKTAGIIAGAERGHRPEMAGGRTAISTMACVAAPPAKLSFFARSITPEEASHQVKVLDIDLNLPAPHDHEYDTTSKSKMSAALGSLLSLGQCSSVTIHAPIGCTDEDAPHGISDGGSVLSVSSSPSSTTSTIPISDSGPS